MAIGIMSGLKVNNQPWNSWRRLIACIGSSQQYRHHETSSQGQGGLHSVRGNGLGEFKVGLGGVGARSFERVLNACK